MRTIRDLLLIVYLSFSLLLTLPGFIYRLMLFIVLAHFFLPPSCISGFYSGADPKSTCLFFYDITNESISFARPNHLEPWRLKQILRACNTAISIDPDMLGGYLSRALIREKMGDEAGAAADLCQARARGSFPPLEFTNRQVNYYPCPQ